MVTPWAVGMARDEEDIVYHTMIHLAANGIKGIIVADNLSKDKTWQRMNEAKEQIESSGFDTKVILIKDDIVAYTQSEKMTNLAATARQYGADWIIPFDIDEIWFSPNKTLYQAFQKLDEQNIDIYKSLYTNHSVTEFDPEGKSPFHSMVYRWTLPTNHKSCFRFRAHDSFVRISNGNHFVQHNGWDIGSQVNVAIDDYGHDHIVFGPLEIQIRHFQWRSVNHFIKKVTNAYQACKALGVGHDLYNGAAWQSEFIEYENGGVAALEKMYYNNVLVKNDLGTLIYDPVKIMEIENE